MRTDSTEMTLTQFCETRCKETWRGTQSAYKNGAKCAVTGGSCNYLFSTRFGEAWMRGNADAEKFIADGGVIITGVKELGAEIARLRREVAFWKSKCEEAERVAQSDAQTT